MNIWENFGVFYQSLDIGGLVVVWGLLFVFLFFMVATFLLFSKNRELGKLLQEKTKKVAELEAEKRTLLEKKIDKVAVKDLNKDIKPVKEKQEATLEEKAIFTDDETDDAPVVNKNNINNNISINSKEDVSDKGKMIGNVTDKEVVINTNSNIDDKRKEEVKQATKVGQEEIIESPSDTISTRSQVSNNTVSSNNNLYSRSALKDNRRFQTSPINIIREESLDETMQKLKPIEIGEAKEDVKRENVNFVEEISRKMEQEIKPQTIELTDYELKQEEEAIISYDELMKNKDRLFKITDDEEDDAQFIEELKYFRNSLQ